MVENIQQVNQNREEQWFTVNSNEEDGSFRYKTNNQEQIIVDFFNLILFGWLGQTFTDTLIEQTTWPTTSSNSGLLDHHSHVVAGFCLPSTCNLGSHFPPSSLHLGLAAGTLWNLVEPWPHNCSGTHQSLSRLKTQNVAFGEKGSHVTNHPSR